MIATVERQAPGQEPAPPGGIPAPVRHRDIWVWYPRAFERAVVTGWHKHGNQWALTFRYVRPDGLLGRYEYKIWYDPQRVRPRYGTERPASPT